MARFLGLYWHLCNNYHTVHFQKSITIPWRCYLFKHIIKSGLQQQQKLLLRRLFKMCPRKQFVFLYVGYDKSDSEFQSIYSICL